MINTVIAKNFQSWENLKFQLRDGVTLIDGWNQDDQTAEGSGKSAILNAICWGLFGKLPKESKIDDVIRDGEKSCEVSIYIDHPIIQSIVRTRKPNDLAIVDINQKAIKGKDARETQKMIEDLVGLSFDTFCQTIYFPQNYPKKFVTATQEERGKILSEIQDLDLFDRARKEVQSLIKLEVKKQDDLRHKIETNTIKYQSNQRAIQQQQDFVNQKIQERDQRVARYEQELNNKKANMDKINNDHESLTAEYSQLVEESKTWDGDLVGLNSEVEVIRQELYKKQTILNDASAVENKKRQIQFDLKKYRYEKEQLAKKRRELVEFIKDPTDNCPTCGTALGEKDTSHAQAELDKINSELQDKGAYADQLEAELVSLTSSDNTQIQQEINTLNQAISQIKSAEDQIKSRKNRLSVVESQINNKKQMVNLVYQEIEKYEKLINDEKNTKIEVDVNVVGVLQEENRMIENDLTELDTLLETSKVYNSRLETLKDGFKEVKSYTFNSVLNELTFKANNYISQLFETPVDLKFSNDNMKIELNLNINGYERGYGLFSGGQQRRIGLAVDLALSEIIAARSGSKCVNVRFLDEYFKDLDENSMQKCLRLLEKLGGSTVLIEHNSVFKSIVDNTVNVELNNQVSKIVA